MMIIQFFVSEPEMKAFFTECGYTVVTKEVTRYRPAVHNRSESYEVDEIHIEIAPNKTVKATELFEQTVKATLMRTDLSAKLAIKSAIKAINKVTNH